MRLRFAFISLLVMAGWNARRTEGQEPSPAGNDEVARVMREFVGRGDLGDGTEPRTAAETVRQLRVADDLMVELVASEPVIEQPIHLSFDHRGRMWVVQYRQYPFPAGLKVVRYDQHLRAIFDRVPLPPPQHVPGADKVTVLEDLDHDGTYETHRDVIEGLNIATSVAVGGGGIWVMNPPYLLFYPDANDDAVPDSSPQVHLSGFGLEDTHSVANSLIFGVDGWLYGANGSTTTAKVKTLLGNTGETPFTGQCVWRYHPSGHRFEIYAEGGGNPFGLEFDSTGHLFSGTNYGETRGMYYPQGSYGIKSWGKHGPLTNRFAFGYFDHMRFQGDGRRFTEEFVVYEDDVLPARYRGQLLAVNPLQRVAFASRLIPDTSTYRTEDFEEFIGTDDRWFRPVDITIGPDGFAYIADWYDTRLTHVDPRDTWHKTSGRIYRVRPKDLAAAHAEYADILPSRTQFDLTSLESKALLRLLAHPSRWIRFASVQVLADRQEVSLNAALWEIINSPTDTRTLEALWVLHRRGEFSQDWLSHRSSAVRRWGWRLIGDQRIAGAELVEELMRRVDEETDPQVRSQIASTAARLSDKVGLAIVLSMLQQDDAEDREDRHIPLLLWWALEKHLSSSGPEVAEAFDSSSPLWKSQLVNQWILKRMTRRSVILGESQDLALCSKLLEQAPSTALRFELMQGVEEGMTESARGEVPVELTGIMERYRADFPQSDLRLRLRNGEETAVAETVQAIRSNEVLASDRIALIEILAELRPAAAQGALLSGLNDASPAIRRACLQALSRYDDPAIAVSIANAYQQSMDDGNGLRPIAVRILTSRVAWAKQLISEIDQLKVRSEMVSPDMVMQMRLHEDESLNQSLDRLWGHVRSSTEEKAKQIEQLRSTLVTRPGELSSGSALFATHCGKCHTMFGLGGQVGPDLTGYERTNFDFLSLAIVDPSAAIREEFNAYRLLTKDGQVLTGLLVNQSIETVELRTAEGQSIIVPRSEIETLQASPVSLMPEGLLDKLDEQQLCDLFTYLRSSAPAESPAESPAETR